VTHHRPVATAFASTDELTASELGSASVRYPHPSTLATPLAVSPRPAAEAAETLGLHTVGDLLGHLPRDTGVARTIADLAIDETATVIAEVLSIHSRPVRRRGMKPLVEAVVGDDSGTMSATFFNQPWLARQYTPGTRLMLSGKYQARNRFRVSTHARTEEVVSSGEEMAAYPATKGITSTQIRALVGAHRASIADVIEPLPARMRVQERLPDLAAALDAAHFGDTEGGRVRLAFDELLLEQLVQQRLGAQRREATVATPIDCEPVVSGPWLSAQLPFEPTGDQRAAMEQIDSDLAQPHPMQRLLMGEVGSGKTVVALHAILRAVDAGRQGALMAPTETLAEQHFATVQALMPGALVPVALLTGATTATRRAEILARLSSGELAFVVGTHALIEDDVRFLDLAVAVVDEQHRFGVRQRAALDAKARDGGAGGGRRAPHVLHMTATPIPRTLQLTAFRALDVTTLRELPRGRQPIDTHLVSGTRERARAYERIREELRAGRQAFVVCPLVEESEVLAARAATAEYERLRSSEFEDFEVVLLHGQMSSRDKAAAMERFASGGADVLVSTTVIEVGIDVPNATVMVVEDADRFGVSQLPQLRGRIGRGEHRSLCLLFGPTASARLRAVADNHDGFALAEFDLRERGQGEITGTRQSGHTGHRFARLPDDDALLARASEVAETLLADDPDLAAPELALLADLVGAALAVPVAA
jgi:ATP-dependent DNA helicase RecG